MLLLGDLSSSSPVAMPWLVLSWMCGFAACRNFAGRGGIYARSHGAARLSGNHGGPRCCCRLPLVLRSQLVVLQAATALSVPPHLTKLRRPRSSRQPSFSRLAALFFLRATLRFSANASHWSGSVSSVRGSAGTGRVPWPFRASPWLLSWRPLYTQAAAAWDAI